MSKKYPQLKFGEVTVQHNDDWIKYAYRYFNYDTRIDPTTNIAILFTDTNEVTSTLDIIRDTTLIYSDLYGDNIHPQTININTISSKKLYKRAVLVGENNTIYLKGFGDIHSNKNKPYLSDASVFNCIYYVIDTNYPDLEKVVFSLFKLKYGVDNTRFVFSYDPEVITKQQTENIIYRLLTSW